MDQVHRDFHTQEVGQKPKLLITDEAIAYALQLEAIDMLLNGDLRKSIKQSIPLSVEGLRFRLGARPDQLGEVDSFLKLACIYFKDPFDPKNLAPDFLNEIAQLYENAGIEMYYETQKGEFKKYTSR